MERIGPRHYETSILTSFYEGYVSLISKIVNTIFCNSRFGHILLEFLCEPITYIKSSYHYVMGRVDVEKFRTNGLNPADLKALKPHKVAVLFIHGCMANPGTWLPISKKIQKSGIGPAFTIDLNDKSWPWNYNTSQEQFQKDGGRVHQWIDSIREKYVNAGIKPPKFVVVGHSRGGSLGSQLVERDDVERVISIGAFSWQKDKKLYEIGGKYDYLMPPSSIQSPGHNTTYHTTHLGLLYQSKVQDKVVDLIAQVDRTVDF